MKHSLKNCLICTISLLFEIKQINNIYEQKSAPLLPFLSICWPMKLSRLQSERWQAISPNLPDKAKNPFPNEGDEFYWICLHKSHR